MNVFMARQFLHRKSKISLSVAMVLTSAVVAACGSSKDGTTNEAQFPVQVTEERVATGSVLYADNCASCHGEPGVSPPVLPTAPPHDENGHTWHHADRLLFEWILDRPPMATVMPAFRGQLTEEETISILSYIKSTWSDDIQEFQSEGSAQYELQLKQNAK
jgi:mono/diheme cytochrome c family protein